MQVFYSLVHHASCICCVSSIGVLFQAMMGLDFKVNTLVVAALVCTCSYIITKNTFQ